MCSMFNRYSHLTESNAFVMLCSSQYSACRLSTCLSHMKHIRPPKVVTQLPKLNWGLSLGCAKDFIGAHVQGVSAMKLC